jgi:hypothetical protein
MKTKFITVAALLMVLAVKSAAALESELSSSQVYGSLIYNIQKTANFEDRLDSLGRLNIDLSKGSISLNIGRKMTYRCPPGTRCMVPMVMPMPYTIELPIIRIEKDSCQNTVYVAQQDNRDVDAYLSTIQVVDHSQSVCEISYPALVEMSYRRETLRGHVMELSGYTTALTRGGLGSFYVKNQLSCSEDPLVADNSVQVSITEVLGTSLSGQEYKIANFSNITRIGFAGVMNSTSYHVTKDVSEVPGAGTQYNSSNGNFSMRLPVVAPSPKGQIAFLNAELSSGEKFYNFQLACRVSQ